MNKEDLISRLVDEFKYPEKGAQIIASKIINFQPEIRKIFERWWAMGEIPLVAVEDYTVTRLQQEHNMNPIAAFLTLDWLKREPEAALASLRRGHDRIIRK